MLVLLRLIQQLIAMSQSIFMCQFINTLAHLKQCQKLEGDLT